MISRTDIEPNKHGPENRVAFITGASSGIGRGIALRLAASGYKVAVLGRREEGTRRVVEEIVAAGGIAVGHVLDIVDRAQVDAAVASVREELGPITVLVACAGIAEGVTIMHITQESWERMIAVNLTGTFNCIQATLPDMFAAQWGRIVTFSSSAAQSGTPDRAHYCAAKAGVIGLTKSVALETAPHGITVNTITPSIIDTPMSRDPESLGNNPMMDVIAGMTPVRRVGTVDDVATMAAYLVSDDAGFITGQQMNVNGGWYL